MQPTDPSSDPTRTERAERAVGDPSGAVARYEERLGAPTFVWLVLVIMTVSLGLTYGSVHGVVWGLVVFAVGQVAGTVALLLTRARVAVDSGVFVAGRARLPVQFVGAVTPLDPDATRAATGPGADARAYLLLRSGTPTAVRVELDDPADPTPYWLVSSRRPEQLARAIGAASAAARR